MCVNIEKFSFEVSEKKKLRWHAQKLKVNFEFESNNLQVFIEKALQKLCPQITFFSSSSHLFIHAWRRKFAKGKLSSSRQYAFSYQVPSLCMFICWTLFFIHNAATRTFSPVLVLSLWRHIESGIKKESCLSSVGEVNKNVFTTGTVMKEWTRCLWFALIEFRTGKNVSYYLVDLAVFLMVVCVIQF